MGIPPVFPTGRNRILHPAGDNNRIRNAVPDGSSSPFFHLVQSCGRVHIPILRFVPCVLFFTRNIRKFFKKPFFETSFEKTSRDSRGYSLLQGHWESCTRAPGGCIRTESGFFQRSGSIPDFFTLKDRFFTVLASTTGYPFRDHTREQETRICPATGLLPPKRKNDIISFRQEERKDRLLPRECAGRRI